MSTEAGADHSTIFLFFKVKKKEKQTFVYTH